MGCPWIILDFGGAEAPLYPIIYDFIFLFQGIDLKNFCGDLERKENMAFWGM